MSDKLSELYLVYDIPNNRVLVTLPGTGEPIGYVSLKDMVYGLAPSKNELKITVTLDVNCSTMITQAIVDRLLNPGDTK